MHEDVHCCVLFNKRRYVCSNAMALHSSSVLLTFREKPDDLLQGVDVRSSKMKTFVILKSLI